MESLSHVSMGSPANRTEQNIGSVENRTSACSDTVSQNNSVVLPCANSLVTLRSTRVDTQFSDDRCHVSTTRNGSQWSAIIDSLIEQPTVFELQLPMLPANATFDARFGIDCMLNDFTSGPNGMCHGAWLDCTASTGMTAIGKKSQKRQRSDKKRSAPVVTTSPSDNVVGSAELICRPSVLLRQILKGSTMIPHELRIFWRTTIQPEQPSSEISGVALDVSVQPLDIDLVRSVPQVPVTLQTHQQRSVAWMHERASSAEQFICDQVGNSPLDVRTRCCSLSNMEAFQEWRLVKAFSLKGGVLCDPVGSGKTLTALSFLASFPNLTGKVADEDLLLRMQASLILCPDHVHKHWESEVHKFGLSEVLSVVSIRTVEALRHVDFAQLQKTKGDSRLLMLVPYSVLCSSSYGKLKSPIITDGTPWQIAIDGYKRHAVWKGYALEAYAWDHIIMDEFHELPQICNRQRLGDILDFLRSSSRFGLSGTPEAMMRNNMMAAARLLGCELNTAESAVRFVQTFFRTNSVNLDVSVSNDLHMIDLHQEEAMLYHIRARDLGLRDANVLLDATQPLTDEQILSLAELMKMCSHFNPNSNVRTFTAAERALNVFKSKQATLANAEARLMEIEDVDAAGTGVQTESSDVNKVQHAASVLHKRSTGVQAEPSDVNKVQNAVSVLPKKAHAEAWRSFAFLRTIWDLMRDTQRLDNCPVCMDDYSVFYDGVLFPCGHLFCERCSIELIQAERLPRCPSCRGDANLSTMVAVRELGLTSNEQNASETLHGQKMADIVKTFESVKAVEPFAKAIFFCQWSGLESCLARALSDAGINFCRLSSCADIFECTEMIESFQRKKSDVRVGGWRQFQTASEVDVMLLNYEHSASGAHLTVANHVFIVHPLVACTPTLSRAYETQAVGRVVRLGQSQKVTVHRFIAANTVESALMERISRP